MRVAVVGAGLAGLSAARELARSGAEVVVLEARDRVGGRVWSRQLDNGAIVEMGAEFVLPGNTAVRELADEYGLGFWDKGMRYGQREPRGVDTDAEALFAAAAVVEEALPTVDPDMGARPFLEGLDIPKGALEALLARVEISSANSVDVVAARDLAGLAHVDDQPAPSVAGGNDRLAHALAEELGPAIHLRSPVERIAWSHDGVRVTANGDELDAAACVVAVPVTMVGAIEFEPGVPAQLADALAGVRMGHAAKLFVPLASTAPPSAVMAVPERYWCWTATGAGDTTQAVVSCFAGSPRALERLETAEGPKRWLDSLAALRPELDLHRADAMVSTWDDDRWVRGAYSTSPPVSLADLAARPIGPLAFAGEHLGGPYAALMEGAIRSGRRAAEALLDAARAD